MKTKLYYVLSGLILLSSFNYAIAQATDAETRLKSWDLHQKMMQESDFKDLTWKAVGPRLQGGRIESIAILLLVSLPLCWLASITVLPACAVLAHARRLARARANAGGGA